MLTFLFGSVLHGNSGKAEQLNIDVAKSSEDHAACCNGIPGLVKYFSPSSWRGGGWAANRIAIYKYKII